MYLFKMELYIKSTNKNLKKKYKKTTIIQVGPTNIQYNKTIIQVCLSVAKNNTIEFNSDMTV